jgi:tripartite-type tricarboxylate transporter receptor subunit TctC
MARARVALFLALSLAACAAAAQYPSRPVRVIVPNPPGGATDTLARLLAPKLGDALGQPLVVENKPGSNGNLASELAARAAPDGHTLLLCADAQIVIGPHLYARMPLDTLKDLAPVATLVNTQMLLVARADLPANNLQEFIDYARAARPPLAYASIGNGSQHHLVMEMLKARAGIDLLHVPFKGGGHSVSGHVRAGRVRALAVAGRQRSNIFPELPRLADLYPGLEVTPWLALFVPAGVPAPVIERLRAETGRLLADPETREQIRRLGGLEPYPTTAEEFKALIHSEYARYGEIVRAVGAKID